MAPTNNIFWCKVFFQNFIKHFRKLNDEQIVRDIRQSMDDLEDLVPDTDSFGSQMVRWALERVDEPFATAARENGKKGGRPKKNTADGDTREDSQDRKSGTSANLYGDSASGDASEVVLNRESGVVEPTTISDFSGARESTRTDGHSLRVGNVARPPVRSGRKFRNKEEFIQWAIDTGLDPDDAGNCWEATMERGGLTKDGKKVDNLCAYTVKWCRTSKKNRETA